ncbi:TPA: hypothetical protein DEP26_00560 [Candidatus Uhrbacteria bacterium]|nr:hypothetical protein [Candidatus Uhrbacteria bacterium]
MPVSATEAERGMWVEWKRSHDSNMRALCDFILTAKSRLVFKLLALEDLFADMKVFPTNFLKFWDTNKLDPKVLEHMVRSLIERAQDEEWKKCFVKSISHVATDLLETVKSEVDQDALFALINFSDWGDVFGEDLSGMCENGPLPVYSRFFRNRQIPLHLRKRAFEMLKTEIQQEAMSSCGLGNKFRSYLHGLQISIWTPGPFPSREESEFWIDQWRFVMTFGLVVKDYAFIEMFKKIPKRHPFRVEFVEYIVRAGVHLNPITFAEHEKFLRTVLKLRGLSAEVRNAITSKLTSQAGAIKEARADEKRRAKQKERLNSQML